MSKIINDNVYKHNITRRVKKIEPTHHFLICRDQSHIACMKINLIIPFIFTFLCEC